MIEQLPPFFVSRRVKTGSLYVLRIKVGSGNSYLRLFADRMDIIDRPNNGFEDFLLDSQENKRIGVWKPKESK